MKLHLFVVLAVSSLVGSSLFFYTAYLQKDRSSAAIVQSLSQPQLPGEQISMVSTKIMNMRKNIQEAAPGRTLPPLKPKNRSPTGKTIETNTQQQDYGAGSKRFGQHPTHSSNISPFLPKTTSLHSSNQHHPVVPSNMTSFETATLRPIRSGSRSSVELGIARSKSTVDYMSCCGLGHRMSKVVDAHYIAVRENLGLRVFFGFCNATTEIFHHFFGPQPLSQLQNVTHRGWALKINNEAPCFDRFRRKYNSTNCPCAKDYMVESGKFFTSLVERFRYREEIHQFHRLHEFSNHTVIGLHVRAGNGETGDFVKKNRAIGNSSAWVASISQVLRELSQGWVDKPPLLFIATDTASIIDEFRDALTGSMNVVDYQQERRAAGSGVTFGAQGANEQPVGEDCILQWKNSLMDMILLSSTDVVVAGRPSSFTQSLPMNVVLARPEKDRKTLKSYCEVAPDVSTYQCFASFSDWCCHGHTRMHLREIRGYEFRRMPQLDFENCALQSRYQKRPLHERELMVSMENAQSKRAFLPFDWDHIES